MDVTSGGSDAETGGRPNRSGGWGGRSDCGGGHRCSVWAALRPTASPVSRRHSIGTRPIPPPMLPCLRAVPACEPAAPSESQ